MIPAGSLNRSLSIYAPVTVRSATGSETTSWRKLSTVRAAREIVTLREVNRMAGRAEVAEVKFVIRYRAGITTAMQVEFEARRFDIVSVEERGNREGLILLVKAV